MCAKGRKPNSKLEKLLPNKKNGGALNFGSTPHRHLMQETARVKVSRRNFFYVMNLLGKKFYWRLVITSWSLANALARISTNDQ